MKGRDEIIVGATMLLTFALIVALQPENDALLT